MDGERKLSVAVTSSSQNAVGGLEARQTQSFVVSVVDGLVSGDRVEAAVVSDRLRDWKELGVLEGKVSKVARDAPVRGAVL